MSDRYTVASPQEAVEALADSRLPMIRAEQERLTQSLWDAAFEEGVKQGKQAAAERTHARLNALAERAAPNTVVSQKQLLSHVAVIFDPERTAGDEAAVEEYQDTTEAIRERLLQKRRALEKRAEFDAHKCHVGDGC